MHRPLPSRPSRRTVLREGGAGAAALLALPALRAQAVATTIVAPFPAGGTLDLPARLLASGMAQASGQQFVVENIGGAGGMLGAGNVAKAVPDGRRLLLISTAQPIAQATFRNPPYDVATSFDHLGMFGGWSTVLAAGPSAEARTLPDLVALARKRPGQIDIASPGNGTAPHLLIALFGQRAGIQAQHVAYRGAAPALLDVLGGRVPYMATGLSAFQPHFKSGRMTPVAVASAKRIAALPDVPTFAELFPGVVVNVWLGLSAPGSRACCARWSTAPSSAARWRRPSST